VSLSLVNIGLNKLLLKGLAGGFDGFAETQSANAYKANAELQLKLKKQQTRLAELESQLEDEQSKQAEARETVQATERRLAALADEVEATDLALVNSEKARKVAEASLDEVGEKLAEVVASSGLLAGQKRKLEAENARMKAELEEAVEAARLAEGKLKKACEDAGRLAEELKSEQEYAQDVERSRAQAEQGCKEAQARLAEMEASAVKGGRRVVAKLERRVADLEAELEGEQRRGGEAVREARRAERAAKEAQEAGGEERRRREAMQEQLERLQARVRAYKAQIEETEELAAFNLSEFSLIGENGRKN